MKIRTGFVSNSSSSSFIIATKKSDKCPHCGRSDLNLIDLIEAIGSRADDSEQTRLRAKGVENVIAHIKKDYLDYCSSDEKKRWKELFKTLEIADKKGYAIAEIEISYHDESTNNMLQDLRKRKALCVLWSDHGSEDNPHFYENINEIDGHKP